MNLISESYRDMNRQLHQAPRGFGGSGWRWYNDVFEILSVFDVKSWLDYGCGQSTLMKRVKQCYPVKFEKIKYREYDPCIRGKNKMPKRNFDLITCTDVLEHVEPKCLDAVIKHIYAKSKKIIFFNINTQLANKELQDGRNAHLIVESPDWWIDRLKQNTDWTIEEKASPRPWKDSNLWSYPK